MDIRGKIRNNIFLRTFVDLFRRPRTVFENNTQYLNHWKFSLSLGGFLFLLSSLEIFDSKPFEKIYGKDNEYISARIADYLAAKEQFESIADLHLTIVQFSLSFFLISYLFFSKARKEFRRFLAMMVYLSGIIIFLFLSTKIIGTAFSIQNYDSDPLIIVPLFIVFFCYICYCFIAFFDNNIRVYLKSVMVIFIWFLILSETPAFTIIDRLYLRIFHSDKIIYESIESHNLVTPIKILDDLRFVASQSLSDSSSLILNFRDDAYHLDKIDHKGLQKFHSLGKEEWMPWIQMSKDTISLYAILQSKEKNTILLRRFTPKSETNDTLILDLERVRGVTQFPSGMHAFYGRNYKKHPGITLLDNRLQLVKTITLRDEWFRHQTFDYVKQISDSILFVTTYELEKDVITNYRAHLLDLQTLAPLKTVEIFKRSGKYTLHDLPEFDLANDSTIVFAFHYPDDVKSQLWLASFNMLHAKENWRKKIDVANDRLERIDQLMCFNEKAYFCGTAQLMLYKDLILDKNYYDYFGSIRLNGENEKVRYLKSTPFYTTQLLGFYSLGKNIFGFGRKRGYDEICDLFVDNSVFQINLEENLE